jgi:Tol biopolymer transport system component
VYRRCRNLALIAMLVAGCGSRSASGPSLVPAPIETVTSSATPSPTTNGPQTTANAPERTPLPSIAAGEAWIAHQTLSAAGYAVHLVRPDGTGLHRWPASIPGTHEHPSWSSDGGRLLLNTIDPDGTEDLWVANADGSEAQRILDCVTPCIWADEPAWSPDDQIVAFQKMTVVHGEPRSTLELLDLATGDVTVVLMMRRREMILAPRWAPDGKRLVVEMTHLPEGAPPDAEPDGGAIGVVDLDSSEPSVKRLTDFETFANSPDWSPTDDLIVFSEPAGVDRVFADLILVTPDGATFRSVTTFAVQGGAATQPAFTPDGERIIYILTRAGKQETVMAVVDLDGSNAGPATGTTYMDGFHPRLRPTP